MYKENDGYEQLTVGRKVLCHEEGGRLTLFVLQRRRTELDMVFRSGWDVIGIDSGKEGILLKEDFQAGLAQLLNEGPFDGRKMSAGQYVWVETEREGWCGWKKVERLTREEIHVMVEEARGTNYYNLDGTHYNNEEAAGTLHFYPPTAGKNALQEIAEDHCTVEKLKWWLERVEEGHRFCPLTMSTKISQGCERLCHKIWPYLKDLPPYHPKENVCYFCPCAHEELDVEGTFRKIVGMAKEQTYRAGDVFYAWGYMYELVICPNDHVMLSTLDGAFYGGDSVEVANKTCIKAKELPWLNEAQYIGHISNMTIKNGEIIEVDGKPFKK